MFQGSTVFVGDSMTVGTSPHVFVDGTKTEIAKVGAQSTWALDAVKGGFPLSGWKNMVVLSGVNDIAAGRKASSIAATLVDIWKLGLDAGLRVYAATLPPFKGWASFNPLAPYEAKRQELNALIVSNAKHYGVTIIPLSEWLADPSDSERLAPAVDSGDHLHPLKRPLGAALSKGASESPSSGAAKQAVVVAVVTGGLGWLASRFFKF